MPARIIRYDPIQIRTAAGCGSAGGVYCSAGGRSRLVRAVSSGISRCIDYSLLQSLTVVSTLMETLLGATTNILTDSSFCAIGAGHTMIARMARVAINRAPGKQSPTHHQALRDGLRVPRFLEATSVPSIGNRGAAQRTYATYRDSEIIAHGRVVPKPKPSWGRRHRSASQLQYEDDDEFWSHVVRSGARDQVRHVTKLSWLKTNPIKVGSSHH